MSFENPKPKSAINRVMPIVFGEMSTDERIKKAAVVQAEGEAHNAERFANQDIPELRDFERPLTLDERKVVDLANRATNKILGRYGAGDFDFPAENIHVISRSKWSEYSAKYGKNSDAIYQWSRQAIVCPDSGSRYTMAVRLVHEMVHVKTFQSVNLAHDESDDSYQIGQRRLGLKSRGRNGEMNFRLLNEALTIELQKKVMREMVTDEVFKTDIEALKQFLNSRASLDPEEIFDWRVTPTRVEYTTLGYVKPRVALNKIIDELYKANQGDFKNREEVFDVFARAALTGALLPLGRLIENTFGPGTFRELGECQTEAQLEGFAKSIKV